MGGGQGKWADDNLAPKTHATQILKSQQNFVAILLPAIF